MVVAKLFKVSNKAKMPLIVTNSILFEDVMLSVKKKVKKLKERDKTIFICR